MTIFEFLSRYAHWFLRLAIGSVFLYHGLTKFLHLSEIAGMMQMPVPMVFMLALVETVGALLVLIGGFSKGWITRLGAIILMPSILGAIILVHWPVWNNFTRTESHPMGGMEFPVTLLFILIYLFIKGNAINYPISFADKSKTSY